METGVNADFTDLHSLQRSTILKVYNYYRILISFIFLYLFLNGIFSEFIGATNPELFRNTILAYVLVNVIIGLSPFIISDSLISKATPSFAILIADIIALTILMSASGGVSSGLGNLLTFTVAFGGALIFGRISTLLPAIAFILTLYSESYLYFLNPSDPQNFFQAGILGIVYFGANIFFQTLSQQLRKREAEVFALEKINQSIVEQMRTGVAVVTQEGSLKLINAAGRQLLYPDNSDKEQSNTLPEDLMPVFREANQGQNKKSISHYTDSNSPELLISFSEIEVSKHDTDALIFIEDSSEVQRQAQQLKLAGLGHLSASIAHEIRNPLGAISHAAQLLAESDDLTHGDRRLSDIIQNHCVRMNNVIENVLQMSRRQTAEPKDLDTAKWLHHFVDEFLAGRNDKPEIIIDLDELPKGSNINFDPIHLSQILGNLCQNGLRYSKRHSSGPKIQISAGLEATSHISYIEVKDWGLGVGEELAQNLFEPFYTTEVSGTGLGLYLSKELCEANQSRLSYSRADTGGSCFRVSFIQQVRQ